MSQLAVDEPLNVKRCTTSPVPSPPACGPAAVAAVPAKIVTRAEREQRPHRPRRRAVGRRLLAVPKAGRARHASAPAATRIVIESR